MAAGTRRFQEAGLLIVIVILGVLLTLAAAPVTIRGTQMNGFLRADNLIPSILTPMSWMAILALGVTVVIVSGGIDISVGAIFCLAALSTCSAFEWLQISENASAWIVIPIGLIVPLAVGGLCGLVNGLIVVGLRMHPFIVTLGTLSIFRGIALISVKTKSLPTPDYGLPLAFTRQLVAWEWHIGAADQSVMVQPVPILIMIICLALVWIFLARSVGGRQVYALGGNEEAARFSGLPVGAIKVRVYVLSGLLAGAAGMVSAGFFGSANTATGEGYELDVIAAAVVGGASLSGGRGTALGAVLGMLVIKLIENGIFIIKKVPLGFTTLNLSKEYTKIIIGIAIVLAVAVDRLSERWRAARR